MIITRCDGSMIGEFDSVVAAVRAGADLSYADLTGANLSDADLSDANLAGANLTGATVTVGNRIVTVGG